MRVTAFVVLACLALAGCGIEERILRENAEDAVRAEVLDPDRARFSDVEVGSGGAVCGMVAAPNRFGGMTPPRRFLVLGDGSVVLEERHSPAFLDELDALAGCER